MTRPEPIRFYFDFISHNAYIAWTQIHELAARYGVEPEPLVALLDALARAGVPADSRSGFNVWIPVREETSAVQRLAASGWAVAAGERFRIRSGPAIRVTTSSLAINQAARLAADIASACRPSTAST